MYFYGESEDTVDSGTFVKDIYGAPIKLAESTTWIHNELICLNLGLNYDKI